MGQYTTKVSNEQCKQWCLSTETLITEHMNEAVMAVKKYIRDIPRLISHVIYVAYDVQGKHGDIHLKATKTKNSGI